MAQGDEDRTTRRGEDLGRRALLEGGGARHVRMDRAQERVGAGAAAPARRTRESPRQGRPRPGRHWRRRSSLSSTLWGVPGSSLTRASVNGRSAGAVMVVSTNATFLAWTTASACGPEAAPPEPPGSPDAPGGSPGPPAAGGGPEPRTLAAAHAPGGSQPAWSTTPAISRTASAPSRSAGVRGAGRLSRWPGPVGLDGLDVLLAGIDQPADEGRDEGDHARPPAASRRRRGRASASPSRRPRGTAGTTDPACGRRAAGRRGRRPAARSSSAARGRGRRSGSTPAASTAGSGRGRSARATGSGRGNTMPRNSRNSPIEARIGDERRAGHVEPGRRPRDESLPCRGGPSVPGAAGRTSTPGGTTVRTRMKTGSRAMSAPQSGMTNCDSQLEDAVPEVFEHAGVSRSAIRRSARRP